jgi:hypothetical protein
MYLVASLRQQGASFLSLTGLKADEFDYLLGLFTPLWQSYHRYFDLKGQRRKLAKFTASSNSSLPLEEDKLFFILCFLKNNGLQTFTGFAFGLSQSKTSQWIKVLLPLLEKSLKQARQLPARSQEQLQASLAKAQQSVFFLAATEHALPRSTDKDNQEDDYSGKSHQHATKNTLLTDEKTRVLFLSQSFEGHYHDKTMLAEEPIQLPSGSILFQELGYLGHRPEGIVLAMPERKPRNKPLSDIHKAINQLINSFRVSVQHAIAGVKRLRIVKDTLRLKGYEVRDQVMLLAWGLHNLRLTFRHP